MRVQIDPNLGKREVSYSGLEDVFGDYETLKPGDAITVMFMCSDRIANATVDHWTESDNGRVGLIYFRIDWDSVRPDSDLPAWSGTYSINGGPLQQIGAS